MASTSGANSATILLADRAGREEIVRALRGMPSHIHARLTSPKLPWTEAFARKHATEARRASLPPASPPPLPVVPISRFEAWPAATLHWSRQHWPELLLPVGVAIGLWALLAT